MSGRRRPRFRSVPVRTTEPLLSATGKPRAVRGVDDDRDGGPGDEADEADGVGSDGPPEPRSEVVSDADPDDDADVADWRGALAAAGRLTPQIVDAIVSTHGGRGRRAIEAVSEGRVKQYRDFTVVVGHDDEYIVEGGGCTCKDAEYNLAPDDPEQRCWHAIAVDVARALGEIDHHDMWYSEVREFL
jgi:predicted nucleic acid-binding Zn finger protein